MPLFFTLTSFALMQRACKDTKFLRVIQIYYIKILDKGKKTLKSTGKATESKDFASHVFMKAYCNKLDKRSLENRSKSIKPAFARKYAILRGFCINS